MTTTASAGSPEAEAGSGGRLGAFWSVWTANIVSNLGDGLYQFALPVMALGVTSSPGAVAGVTVMLTLAWPLFGLQAGAVVDAFDRRRILVAVNAGRAVVLAGMTALVLSGGLSMPVLYAAALILGLGETLVDTSLTSIVPAVVSRDRLEWANGRIAAGQTVANQFVGPPLGGVLIGLGWAAPTGLAAGLYGLAVGALGVLRGTYRASAQEPVSERTGRLATMVKGFRFLWRQPLLRRITIFTAAMNVWWAAWTAVFVVYALAPGPMGLSTVGYGLVLTGMAAGGLIGSLLTERVIKLLGTRNALVLDLVGTVLLIGVPALTASAWLVGAATFAAGLGASVWVVAVASIRQRLTPDALLGRVYSASRLISWGILPVGATLGGLVSEIAGVTVLFAAGGVASVLVLGAFLITTHERDFAIETLSRPA